MALIDEYKQAIKDVLDGRAPEAPKPSELPETEDKLATMWAAAAAELLAEAHTPPAPEPELPDTPGSNGTYMLKNTVSGGSGTVAWEKKAAPPAKVFIVSSTDTGLTMHTTLNGIAQAFFADAPNGTAVFATHAEMPIQYVFLCGTSGESGADATFLAYINGSLTAITFHADDEYSQLVYTA